MAVQLHTAEDIPEIIREMTLEEKCTLLTGGSNFGTAEMPKYGIPHLQVMDNGAGLNLRQYLQETMTRGTVKASPALLDTFQNGQPAPSQAAYLLDRLDRREELTPAENELLDSLLAYIRDTYDPGDCIPDCFPVNSLLASTWSRSTVREVARAVGAEASALGADVLLGTSCINIQRDPLGGRNFECWSEDPYLTGELAKEVPLGVQEQGVLADVKHFAVNNQETNRHTVDVEVSQRALREIYLPAFKKLVQEGQVRTVMTSYNSINGCFSSENKWLLEDVLRGEWGFQGLVMSDWGGVYHRGPSAAAGNDLCMPARLSPKLLADAAERGEVSEQQLDESCRRMLEMILESPRMKGRKVKKIDSAAARRTAYKAAAEGIVLLKNDGLLPLQPGDTVSFFGPLSTQFMDCGVGSGRVHTTKTSSLLASAAAISGEEHVFFESVEPGTKAVVVTVGAGGQEGADRRSMALGSDACALIEKAKQAAASVGAKLVLLLNVAGPVELAPYLQDAAAVLCLYLPGEEGAHAAADILYGAVNPSGHLAQTWPKKYIDCPTALNFPGEYDRVCYGEGIYVGYRYYDKKQVEPEFPCGFGLSYTEFELRDAAGEAPVWYAEKQDAYRVSVTVANTGRRAGSACVQLYAADVRSSLPRPEAELKGFEKVYLEPGEEKRVELVLHKEDLQFYDEKLGFTLEPGRFELRMGFSSRDIRQTVSVSVKAPNPYGYGMQTPYQYLLWDRRAVDTINRVMPEPFLDAAELKRESNYLAMNITLEKAYKRFMIPKFRGLSEEQHDALLRKLAGELAEIDISENELRYEEVNVE